MTAQTPPPFGALLRTFRRAAGLTQEALAERAHLSKRGLQDLERGLRQTPRRDTMDLLATALGLAAADRAALFAAARPHPLTTAGPAPTSVFAGDALVPLMGRDREVALLDHFLSGERPALGPASVLLLAGEPGIGKTRLLQAAAQRAIARGWCVLVGGCQRRGGQGPYAPLLDALAQHLQVAGPGQRRAALEGCAWLVRLLPELAEDPVGAAVVRTLPAGALPPEQERRLVFLAVRRLLANVAGPAGTLLVLDDLQWAGPDALDLIEALARAPEPVRLVGAYRDTEVRAEDPLGLLLADLAQARLIRQHTLGPLDTAEAAALLDDLLVDVAPGDRGLVERILQRAEGTPFFLVSYVQAVQHGGAEGVPWDLTQGVRQRVALLPEAARHLLEVAAIVGRRVPRGVLVAAAGQPPDAVLVGLEAACRARLLEEQETDYAFAHDVIREVVEAGMGTARRALLHGRVAQALDGDHDGAQPEVLAYHYARSDLQERAVLYLERAGDHAWAQRAHGAAEDHFRAALDRLERLGRSPDALRVREKLGDVLKGTARYDAALQVLEPAAETYRAAGDGEGWGRVTASIAEVQGLRGQPEEGLARLRPALEHLEGQGVSPALAALYLCLGVLQATTGRYDESLAAGARAAELARASGDARTLVQGEWNRANILQLLGRLDEALRAGHEVLTLAETVGDLEGLVAVPRDLAYIHALRGAFAAARQAIDRSLAAATQVGNPANLSLTLAVRGWIAVLSGDWSNARADLDQARALVREAGRSWYAPYPPIFQARLSLAEGAWEAAGAQAEEALALGAEGGDPQAVRLAAGVLAELDLMQGRPEAARTRLLPLLDRAGLEECDVTTLLPLLAWAHLELGQIDEAADTVEQALRRARPAEMRLVLVEALRVGTLIVLRQGRRPGRRLPQRPGDQSPGDEAARSMEEGLTLARAMPYPYAEARLLWVQGMLLAQQGQPEAARERLEAARAIAARLGARGEVQRVEQALDALSQNDALGGS